MPKKHVVFPVPVYLERPFCAQQAQCSHRKLNAPKTHCCQCGARREQGSRRYVYLDSKWFPWYRDPIGQRKPWL